MDIRTLRPLSLFALMIGGGVIGCAGAGMGIATAGDRAMTAAAKTADRDAVRAGRALTRHDAAAAVGLAEAAVALVPRNAEYRMLLAQAYLQDGRFASARQAYGDVLQLTPANGKAALNQALATIATGDWQAARAQLADAAAVIPARDRGLALALAGDTQGAITLLTALVRSPDGDARARQNLALSFALAGQWQAARLVAGMDLTGGDLDRRLQQWAAFAQPAAASDQVAALLGVRAVPDQGRPLSLALAAPVPVVPTIPMIAPAQAAASVPVEPLPVAEPPPVAVAAATVRAPDRVAAFSFGPRAEVVEKLPVATILAPKRMAKIAVGPSTATPAARGPFVVQLGAFENAGVAKDAWGRARRRMQDLAGHTPQGMTFAANNGSFYRLSVGGFTRADADALCGRYRARGGACFVRKDGGDRTAQWLAKPATQLASR